MSSSERYHRGLRVAALGIAAFNLLCLFACDMREWIVYFDPIAIRMLVWPAFLLALPALPFLLPLDRSSQSGRKIRWGLVVVSITSLCFESLWLFQIAVATFLRGPDWNLYWPWEDHLPKLIPLNNVDLSEYFWVSVLGRSRPTEFLTREAPGLVLVGIHLVAVPLLAVLAASVLRRRIAIWRIALLAFAFQWLTLIALKVLLRCSFNLKYFIAWYEQMLNL